MVKNYLLKYICTPIIAFITGMYISLAVYSVIGTITGVSTPLYNMIPESLFLSVLLYGYMGHRYSDIEMFFERTIGFLINWIVPISGIIICTSVLIRVS